MNHDAEEPRDERREGEEFDAFEDTPFESGPAEFDVGAPREHPRDAAVLDANLSRLLRRAYVPVVAHAAFRARLERQFLDAARALRDGDRAQTLSGSSDAAREALGSNAPRAAVVRRLQRPWTRPIARIALAASIAAVAVLGFRAGSGGLATWWARWTGSSSSSTFEEILARGDVAWRERADAPWNAHPADGGALSFAKVPSHLELATPGTTSTRVDFSALDADDLAAPWEVSAQSHVEFAMTIDSLRAELRSGSLGAHRSNDPNTTRSILISTTEGDIELVRGQAQIAYRALDDREQWIGEREPRVEFVHIAVTSGQTRVPDAFGTGVLSLGDADALYLASGAAWLPRATRVSTERVALDRPLEQPDPSGPTSGIFGRVSSNGVPVESFRLVSLRDVQLPQRADPTSHAFDHPDGSFELTTLAPGRYTLFAVAPGCAVFRSEVLEISAQSSVRLDIALNSGALATGVVVDEITGEPLSDAYVVSETDSQITVLSFDESDNAGFDRAVRTRGNGAFDFPRLSAGTQFLRASAPGHGAAWIEVDLALGAERRDLVFRLPRAGRIQGSVRDAFDAPVARALVLASTTDFQAKRPCLSYRSTLTDDNGDYALEDLGPGAWAMLNFGQVEQLRTSSLTPEMAFGAVRSDGTTTINFHARRPPQSLRGVVRDAAGEPVRRRSLMVAPVQREYDPIESGWSSCATLDDGSYSLPGLEPGPYELFISLSSPSEMMRVARFEIPSGANVTRDFVVPSQQMSGQVIDGERGVPMSGAVLVLLREREDGEREFYGKVFSNSDGRFRFEFAPEGRFDLYAYSTRGNYGQEALLGLVVTGESAPQTLAFTLKLGGRVAVKVQGTEGQPVAGANIEFVDASGKAVQFSDQTLTTVKGHYVVNGIKPGRWTVRASFAGLEDDAADFEVAAEERVDVTLTLRAP